MSQLLAKRLQRAGKLSLKTGQKTGGRQRDAFLEKRGQSLDDFTAEMVQPLVGRAALIPA
ncbi:hypothetical protein [Sphingomonas elodea]|uniref:hypothetical protein n=1 Tax=Sphingomonas elodea TaxID=179878 RepID=UPI000A014653|nr:hypothetical protein [Sphingomonas elodea]